MGVTYQVPLLPLGYSQHCFLFLLFFPLSFSDPSAWIIDLDQMSENVVPVAGGGRDVSDQCVAGEKKDSFNFIVYYRKSIQQQRKNTQCTSTYPSSSFNGFYLMVSFHFLNKPHVSPWQNFEATQASYNFIICKYLIMYLVKIFLKSPRQLSHLKKFNSRRRQFLCG